MRRRTSAFPNSQAGSSLRDDAPEPQNDPGRSRLHPQSLAIVPDSVKDKPIVVHERPERRPRRQPDGPVFVEPERPHVASGLHELFCVQAETEERFNRKVVKLTFQNPLSGTRVYAYFNMRVTRGSKFYEAWTIANGAPPKSRQVMGIRVFKGKFFEVEVRDTTKSYDGRKLKPGEGYSVVDRIVRRTQ